MGAPREVRVRDDIVERPVKPWTGTVHALLASLHATGLPVPEPLGYGSATERVRLVPGAAGAEAWPHQLTAASVRSAGQLLRRVHDASAEWDPPDDAVWAVPFATGEVICHGDPQPANFAWRDGRVVGLFDWDAARPGDRLSDIAYALEWFTPFTDDAEELRSRGFQDEPDRTGRIEALLDGYGWHEPFDIVEAVAARQQLAIDEVVSLGRLGHDPQAHWVAEGWPERWQEKLVDTRRIGASLGRELESGMRPRSGVPLRDASSRDRS